jgi:hypothetical protein
MSTLLETQRNRGHVSAFVMGNFWGKSEKKRKKAKKKHGAVVGYEIRIFSVPKPLETFGYKLKMGTFKVLIVEVV